MEVDMQHMRSSEPVFEENPPRKSCSSPPCKYCGKVFGSLKALHGHMRSHSKKLPSSSPFKRKRASRKPRQDSSSSSSSSSSSASSDSEEEEMRKMWEAAECLLMLSRGRWVEDFHHHPLSADSETTPVSADSEAEEEKKKRRRRVYTCVTCGRTFGSFQALGGHRAYHNRCSGEEDRPMKAEAGEVTSKVHACEVCEKVFPTGQALGGHMRKHYNAQPLKQGKTEEEPRPAAIPSIALFDLNLPPVPEY